MKKTNNYGLNQWESNDPVKMADFNADNAKIDAALADIKNEIRYVEIARASAADAVSRLDLDVSGVDWSRYLKAELFVCGHAKGSDLTLQVNGLSTGYYAAGPGTGSTGDAKNNGTSLAGWLSQGGAAVGVAEFPTPHPDAGVSCFNASAAAAGSSMSYTSGMKIAPITWSKLKTFNLLGALPAGTQLILCGVTA